MMSNNDDDDDFIDDRLNEEIFNAGIEDDIACQIAVSINTTCADNNDGTNGIDDDSDDDDDDVGATTEDVIMVFQTLMNVQNTDNNINNETPIDDDNNDTVNNEIDHDNNVNDSISNSNSITDNNNNNNIAYPMHYAVFHRDIFTIENLLQNMKSLQEYDINDNMSNTPLMLSIKLGFNEISYLLLQNGFNFNVKSSDGYHLLDEALLSSRDYRLIRDIYIKVQMNLAKKWTDNVNTILETLGKIPDFYLEMTWKFEAKGLLKPLIALLNPRDTYKIYKKGNYLRIDSTISGIRKGFGLNPIKRGAVSLLLIGNSHDNIGNFLPGELIKIDHDSKKYKRLIERLQNPDENTISQNVKILMSNTKKKKTDTLSFDIDNINFIIDNNTKSDKEKLKWSSSRWIAEGDVSVLTLSKTSNIETTMTSSEYFEFSNNNDNESAHDSNGDINDNTNLNNVKHSSLLDKRMKAKLYLTEELPITMNELMPIIEVLTFDEKKFGPLLKLFNESKKQELKGFPIKTKISLLLGVSLTLTIDEFQKYESSDSSHDNIYNIGSDYIDDTQNET